MKNKLFKYFLNYKIKRKKKLFIYLLMIFTFLSLTFFTKINFKNIKINLIKNPCLSKINNKAIIFLLTFDPQDLSTILLKEIPLFSLANKSAVANKLKSKSELCIEKNDCEATFEKSCICDVNEELGNIKISDLSQKKLLKNKTAFRVFIENETENKILNEELLNSQTSFEQNSIGPKVLILHTYTTQSYMEKGAIVFNKNEPEYTLDSERNVLAVGQKMTETLNECGIAALHDTTAHDLNEKFLSSYSNSLKTIEEYKKKFPTIEIFLDLHRDSLSYDANTKIKLTSQINNETYAQCMFVVGTDGGGLYHPNWKNNLTFAAKLQDKIEKKYPGVMRPINIKKERLNGHVSNKCIIIKIGTQSNSIDEAVKSGQIISECMAEFLKEQNS